MKPPKPPFYINTAGQKFATVSEFIADMQVRYRDYADVMKLLEVATIARDIFRERKPPMTLVKDDIAGKARTDGSFAIAYAMLQIASELGNVAKEMNEFRYVFERSVNLTGTNEALDKIATVIEKKWF